MKLTKIFLILFCITIVDQVKAFDKDKIIKSTWKDSIMFSKENFAFLKNALEISKQHKLSNLHDTNKDIHSNIKHVNPQLLQREQALIGAPRFSPSFFVNAIIYESDESWLMWVNDVRYASQFSMQMGGVIDEIKLLDIKADYAHFSITTKALDELSPNWKNKLILGADNIFKSSDNLITLDRNNNIVTFVLRASQTFVLYDMEIVDGRKPFHQLNKI